MSTSNRGVEMDDYFTDDKIFELVTRHGWEMVPAGDSGKYKLRQKDKHYMTTADFEATPEAVHKWSHGAVTTDVPRQQALSATRAK